MKHPYLAISRESGNRLSPASVRWNACNRARVYAAVRSDLRYLDLFPDAPDRADRIQAMVATAEPLIRLLGQRIDRGAADHTPLIEVLTRRYYSADLDRHKASEPPTDAQIRWHIWNMRRDISVLAVTNFGIMLVLIFALVLKL